MWRLTLYLIGIPLLVLQTGCASGLNRLYDGLPRPMSEVAFLRGHPVEVAIWPVIIDRCPMRRAKWIELAAGKHTVDWRWTDGRDTDEGSLDIVLEAGHLYGLAYEQVKNPRGAYIVDRGVVDEKHRKTFEKLRKKSDVKR